MGKYLEQTVWAGCLAGCGDGWTGGYAGLVTAGHWAAGARWADPGPVQTFTAPRAAAGRLVTASLVPTLRIRISSVHTCSTSSKEGAETGQASGQQWLEVPRLLLALSAAVLQGTDRGVAADLVTADCSTTPAAAAAGHKRPSWSWSCS